MNKKNQKPKAGKAVAAAAQIKEGLEASKELEARLKATHPPEEVVKVEPAPKEASKVAAAPLEEVPLVKEALRVEEALKVEQALKAKEDPNFAKLSLAAQNILIKKTVDLTFSVLLGSNQAFKDKLDQLDQIITKLDHLEKAMLVNKDVLEQTEKQEQKWKLVEEKDPSTGKKDAFFVEQFSGIKVLATRENAIEYNIRKENLLNLNQALEIDITIDFLDDLKPN